MHFKNRKPRTWSGCCRMCSCQTHDGGLRNKRLLTPGELRATDPLHALSELDSYRGRLVEDAASILCGDSNCETCGVPVDMDDRQEMSDVAPLTWRLEL